MILDKYKKPIITIGITSFKEGEWLRDCWESVLAQNDHRWEAVIVLDGGADNITKNIFSVISHPKLRKFKMPSNKGPYPTRNKAFELTETPYHFYLDGDDQLLPNTISYVLDTFDKYPEAGFVYGDMEYFGTINCVVRIPHHVTVDDFIASQPIPGPACAYKKRDWLELGGYSKELNRGNGDYDFHMSLFEKGITGIHSERIIYRYRVGNPGKISSSYNRTYHQTHEIMVKKHPYFFKNIEKQNLFLAYAYKRSAIANFLGEDMESANKYANKAISLGLKSDIWVNVVRYSTNFPTFLVIFLKRMLLPCYRAIRQLTKSTSS